MTLPASPRRRKVRMLRPGGSADDMTLLIRATPASFDAAMLDMAEDALESAAVYEVDRPDGRRVALYGVSVSTAVRRVAARCAAALRVVALLPRSRRR